ncbi:MAG: chemotaxis-specific protein-glutamate methyltransferase CheB [Bosea sp. (in: a-proteobacteria)]
MSQNAALREQPNAARKRVLVVDDSVVVRGLFSRWLADAEGLEVIGTAGNGLQAIEAVSRLSPDIVVLDLDMPEMDGLTALPLLLKADPKLSIVVASTLTERNARLSMQCLALGAIDVLGKPSTNRDLTLSVEFRQELVRKLQGLESARPRALAPARSIAPEQLGSATAGQSGLVRDLRPYVTGEPRFLLIGASTGGPRAVAKVLGDIGGMLKNLTTLVVQHMPPVFTASFASQIATHTGTPAREPHDGERLVPGNIYIAPGGRHFGIARQQGHPVARICDGPPVRFCRPAVDVLFNDAASLLGTTAIAVVLTGMGADGTDGARSLRAAGCAVIAQDEASSVVWGMPGSVAKAGLASLVMPANEIGLALRFLAEKRPPAP